MKYLHIVSGVVVAVHSRKGTGSVIMEVRSSYQIMKSALNYQCCCLSVLVYRQKIYLAPDPLNYRVHYLSNVSNPALYLKTTLTL